MEKEGDPGWVPESWEARDTVPESSLLPSSTAGQRAAAESRSNDSNHGDDQDDDQDDGDDDFDDDEAPTTTAQAATQRWSPAQAKKAARALRALRAAERAAGRRAARIVTVNSTPAAVAARRKAAAEAEAAAAAAAWVAANVDGDDAEDAWAAPTPKAPPARPAADTAPGPEQPPPPPPPPLLVWTLVLERADIEVLETSRWVCRTVRALADGDDHLWRRQLSRLLPTTPYETLLEWRQAFGHSWRRLCRYLWAALQADVLGRLPTLREIAQGPRDSGAAGGSGGAGGPSVDAPATITVEAFRQGSWTTSATSAATGGFYGLQVSADPSLQRRARIMAAGIPAAVRAGWLPRIPDAWRISSSLSATARGLLVFRPWIIVALCNDSILFVRIVGDDVKDTAEIMVAASLPTRVHTPSSLVLLTRPDHHSLAADSAAHRPRGGHAGRALVVVAAVAVSYVVYLYDALTGAPLIWHERGMLGNALETPRTIAALASDGRYLVASLDDGSLCLWPLDWFDQHRTRADGVRVTGAPGLLAPIMMPPFHVAPPRGRSLVPPVAVQVDVPAAAEADARDTLARVRVVYQHGELEWWSVGPKRARVCKADGSGVAPGPDPAPSPFGAGLRGRVWEFVDQTPALGPEVLLVNMFSLGQPQRGTSLWALSDFLQPEPYLTLDPEASAAIDPLREPAKYLEARSAAAPASNAAAAGGGSRRLRSLDEYIVQAYDVPVDAMRACGGVWSLPSLVFRHRPGPAAGGPAAAVPGRTYDERSCILRRALTEVDPSARPLRSSCPIGWRRLELRCWEGVHSMRRLHSRESTDQWLPLSSVPWVRGWPLARLLTEAARLLEQEHAMPLPESAARDGRKRGGRDRSVASAGPGRVPAELVASLAPTRRGRNWLCVRVRAPKWDLPHLYIAWQQHTWELVRSETRQQRRWERDHGSGDDDDDTSTTDDGDDSDDVNDATTASTEDETRLPVGAGAGDGDHPGRP